MLGPLAHSLRFAPASSKRWREPIRASEHETSNCKPRCFRNSRALPLLPVCGIVLLGEPAMVFFIGAIAFILEDASQPSSTTLRAVPALSPRERETFDSLLGVMLLVWLLVASSMPPAGWPPVARPLRFTIREARLPDDGLVWHDDVHGLWVQCESHGQIAFAAIVFQVTSAKDTLEVTETRSNHQGFALFELVGPGN
jgi:hypothetical protein